MVPKGFFPQEDTGFLTGTAEAATDTSFEAMVERQRKLDEIVREDPAVELRQYHGRRRRPDADRELRPHLHRLKPKAEREPAEAVIARLRQKTAQIPGMRRSSRASRTSMSAAARRSSQYQYTLQSSDTETLYTIAPEMRTRSPRFPALLDVTTDLYIKNPQMTVEIDREKAAVYGIGADQIRQELFNAFGSRQIGTIFTPSNDYQIILEAQPHFRVDPSDLSKIYLKTANNQTIPLDAVARMVPTVGPLQINHQGQQPVGDDFVQSRARRLARPRGRQRSRSSSATSNLPGTITTGFQGTAQVFQDSLHGQGDPGSRRRSSPPTSCSAFSTKASSIRSRSSPACRRPASARS